MRHIGQRWGARLKTEYFAEGRRFGTWPGTLDEARRQVDAAAGPVSHEERELLALLVERGARRAWHSTDVVAEAPPRAPSRSGVMLKPAELDDLEPDVTAPKATG
jgi:hypothetical protein